MPKLKTKKSAAKRFKKTAGSVIKRGKASRRHILSNKNRKRKRHLRKPGHVAKSNLKAVKKIIAVAR